MLPVDAAGEGPEPLPPVWPRGERGIGIVEAADRPPFNDEGLPLPGPADVAVGTQSAQLPHQPHFARVLRLSCHQPLFACVLRLSHVGEALMLATRVEDKIWRAQASSRFQYFIDI